MNWVTQRSEYGKRVHIVTLDDDDRNRTDLDMITAADNHGEYGHRSFHFGGYVEPLPDGTVEIGVYTD